MGDLKLWQIVIILIFIKHAVTVVTVVMVKFAICAELALASYQALLFTRTPGYEAKLT